MTNNKYNDIFYITDFSLPNMSAYALHVLKMCDAFSEDKNNVSLLLPYIKKEYKFEKIKYDYLLKNFFQIKGFFNSKIKRNFFSLFIFSLRLYKFFSSIQKPCLIISRSIVPALLLSIFRQNVILEIHTELQGWTKYIFSIFKFFNLSKNLKFILINKKLNDHLKLQDKDFIILDDCVDFRDFHPVNEKKNSCVYTGSFVKGKGVETILNIASNLPNINFILYGNLKTLDKDLYDKILKEKNISLNNFVSYREISEILPRNKVLLMPYEKKVGVLIDNLDVSNYISPLKLFDYLAAGSIIIATRKDAYAHVLKDKYNCFLVNSSNPSEWCEIIKTALTESPLINEIKKNSLKSAKIYNWLNRVDKIHNFFNNKL